MNQQERIRELMQKVARGRETADQVIAVDPRLKRVVAMPKHEAAQRDLLTVTPEDMKVSAGGREGVNHGQL